MDFLGPPQVILHEVEIRVEDVNERRVEHSAIGARLRHDQPPEEPAVDEQAHIFGTPAPERRSVAMQLHCLRARVDAVDNQNRFSV